MKTSLPVAVRVLRVERIALPLTIVVLLGMATTFYWDWSLRRSRQLEIQRLQRVLETNEALVSALKDAESAQLGYLLTGNQDYLGPYRKAKAELPDLVARLADAVSFPDQVERVDRLRSLVQEELAAVDATILVRDQVGPDQAMVVLRTLGEKRIMDTVRQVCSAISQVANEVLLTNSTEMEARYLRSRVGFLVGCGLLVVLLGASLALIQRTTARREDLMQKLDESSRRFQVTLSSIGDGVITADGAGLVTFLNPIAATLTGWSPQEADGHPLESVLPLINESTGEVIENPARQAIRERRTIAMANHTNLKRRDGSWIPVDDSVAPIFDAKEELKGIVMVFRDVTPRRAVERELRQWHHIFEHAGFGMAVLTPGVELTLKQVNPAFASMHGKTQEELIGRPYSEIVDPEVWPAKMKLLQGSSPTDHLVTESIHVHKDGSRLPVRADFTIVRGTDCQIEYYLEYCSDVSERKRAEEELLNSEQRYRVTADSLPQLIWTSKPDGATEYLNNRWHEEMGVTLDQIGEQGWISLLSPEDRERSIESWNNALRTGESFQTESLFKTRDGSKRWYHCRAIPVRDSSGRIVRWFGSCSDIHDQKIAAEVLRSSKEELQLANEALKRSNTDLEQFAYAASHDLQEPLRMVAIYSQLLKEEYGARLDDQANAYLGFAANGALRMEALLRDLLAYSRAATPEDQPVQDVDSQEALTKALDNLTVLIQESGSEVSRGLLPHVRMPEVHLVQIFQNLISNSIKYRKPNVPPRIHVEASLQDSTWVYSVSDNGLGIAPQHQGQIFRIFGRLQGQEVAGTGLGLALCKKLVERNGGSIWVESAEGEGATFFFSAVAAR